VALAAVAIQGNFPFVMAALEAAIQGTKARRRWMAGSSPAMTIKTRAFALTMWG
jgi:hypothetical protein